MASPCFSSARRWRRCTTAPPPADADRPRPEQYEKLLAGKVAGKPISCLPTYRANDMVMIDEQTIAFRDGSSRVYVTPYAAAAVRT